MPPLSFLPHAGGMVQRAMAKFLSLATFPLVLLTACGGTPPADPTWVAEIEAWRAQRLASLTAEEGWLTLVGLHWLRPGPNRVGSAPDSDVYLEGEGVPAEVATLTVTEDWRVFLSPSPTGGLEVDGQPALPGQLATDRDGTPSRLTVGPLRMVVIRRGDQLALRVRNPAARARSQFKGLTYFPIDPRYRVTAQLEPFDAPREVVLATAQGPSQRLLAPGVVRFTLRGRQLALTPLLGSPTDTSFFFVFRDATSGKETYGAGRFLDAAAPAAGSTTFELDFNRAYNPPCAFTPFATCPLPPPENLLPVAIRAGEKRYGEH